MPLAALTLVGCSGKTAVTITTNSTVANSSSESTLTEVTASTAATTPTSGLEGAWTITQLSNSSANKFFPCVGGNYVVWSALDGRTHYDQIYLFDIKTGETRQISNNQLDNMNAQVSQGRIFWESSTNLILYDTVSGSTKTIAATVNLSSRLDSAPVFVGNLVVWQNQRETRSADAEVDLWDTRTAKVKVIASQGRLPSTDGRHVVWEEPVGKASALVLLDTTTGQTQTLPNSYNVTGAPEVSGGYIVWSASDGKTSTVYLYDVLAHSTKPLTSPSATLYFPQTDGGLVVWRQQQLASTSTTQPFGEAAPGTSIVLYDAKTGRRTEVSDNVLPGTLPRLKDGLVLWEGVVNHVKAVFVYDIRAKDTFQLPNKTDILDAYQVSTSDAHVAWAGWTAGRYEIFLATRSS